MMLSHAGILKAFLLFDWLFGGQAEDSAVGWLRRESLGLA